MPLHFTSGGQFRFLFWFEYGGEFQFAAAMIGKPQRGTLLDATFKSAGIYMALKVNPSDDGLDFMYYILGRMVSDSNVPFELLSK